MDKTEASNASTNHGEQIAIKRLKKNIGLTSTHHG